MKKDKRILLAVIYVVIGIVLMGFAIAGKLDEFWSGMGSTLLVIGILRLVRAYRINKNEAYREKLEVEASDERNQFIRNKAWAWAGYMFVIIMGVAVIVFKVMGQETMSMAAGMAVCLVITLFWISFYVLRRKY